MTRTSRIFTAALLSAVSWLLLTAVPVASADVLIADRHNTASPPPASGSSTGNTPPASGSTSGGASTSKDNACAALKELDSTKTCDGTDEGLMKLVKAVVQILSIIIGIAAVIMVIIAGLKYVTSSGDSNGINSAKNTLIYALIGLFIAALAQFLVKFVLQTASK